MIGMVIVLIVLIVVIAVLIIHANNKHSAIFRNRVAQNERFVFEMGWGGGGRGGGVLTPLQNMSWYFFRKPCFHDTG